MMQYGSILTPYGVRKVGLFARDAIKIADVVVSAPGQDTFSDLFEDALRIRIVSSVNDNKGLYYKPRGRNDDGYRDEE